MPNLLFPGVASRLRLWAEDRPRRWKKLFFICFDALLLVAIVWLSFSLRLGEVFRPNLEQALLMLAAPLIALPVFARMGLYRAVLRYLPERAVWKIAQAVTIATLIWVSLAFLTQMTGLKGIPRTIPLLFWLLTTATITFSRFAAKRLLQGGAAAKDVRGRTLIYGTGEAGTQLANALRSIEGRNVIGFVSDDASLHGMDILGLRVYPPSELANIVANFGIQEVVITTSTPTPHNRRDLVARLGALPVKIRILPAIADLAAGKYLVSYIRDVDVDDLLGRSQVPADPQLLRTNVQDRVVLVTGAAGSIGSAVCRTVAGLKPSKLVLVELNEHGLYEIGREIAAYANFPVVSLLGSVGDRHFIESVLEAHAVDTIYHCAAYKHVPLVEENALEGVRNNIFGTQVLAEAAYRLGVPNLVLISSDKAVRPANVMGATKRWSELIVRHYGSKPGPSDGTRNFCSVRFGNVIGSSGSVVPLFKEQIANGGPVTVTHEETTRYFMSVREAAELILQASALSQSGDILLLEMGEPVRIRSLAEDMIVLAGLTVRDADNPDGDIEIKAVGLRAGEKLHEELFYDPAGVATTSHPKILRAKRQNGLANHVPAALEDISAAIAARDEEEMRRILFAFVQHGTEKPAVEQQPALAGVAD